MIISNHYVATGYVFDRSANKFLLVLQKKSEKWLPPGGHLKQGEIPRVDIMLDCFHLTWHQLSPPRLVEAKKEWLPDTNNEI